MSVAAASRSEPDPIAPPPSGAPNVATASEIENDFVELYVSVGRRDGARAADVQRALQEGAALDKNDIARIRVRDRHTFVSVRKSVHTRALAALSAATIAGRVATAEVARERRGHVAEDPESGGPASGTSETTE
jgi:ATP-dependent RNA helicase DeaD